MRSAGITLSLVLLLLLAGCYQNAGETSQSDSQLPSSVATFTPQPAGLPVTAVAAVDPGPAFTAVPPVNQAPEQQEIDPLNMTATAIVARATQLQAERIAAGQATAAVPVVVADATATQILVATSVVATGNDCIHVVQAVDRGLSTIAQLYGVTLVEIQQANGLANVDIIHIGNELVIPGCGTTGYRQSEAPGESCQPAEWSSVHTVLAGENLFRIALFYGVDMDELALFNCIPDPTLINVGQQIYIP